jgi:hypothetical protein
MSTAQNLSLDPNASAFYRRIDDSTCQPTLHAQGVWRENEQHMGPPSALLAHALETFQPRPDMCLSRISYEILGVIYADKTEISVEVVRPGRTVEMLQAQLVIGGRTVIRATGWRLGQFDTRAAAGGAPEPLEPPHAWPDWDGIRQWPGGYIRSLECRASPKSVPGHGTAWLRTAKSVIEDEPVSDLAAFTALVDPANGITRRLDSREWAFPNLDLTIHYFRSPRFADPAQSWVGVDASTVIEANGIGLTSSTLYDSYGAVGRAEQILTVRKIG